MEEEGQTYRHAAAYRGEGYMLCMFLLLACTKADPEPIVTDVPIPVVENVIDAPPLVLPNEGLRPDLSSLSPLSPEGEAPEIGAGPLVLALWASWCPPCQKELPHLQELQSMGVPILAASVDLPDARERAVLLHGKVSPELRAAWAPELAVALGTEAIPALYVYDSQGQLVWHAEETFTEEELGRALYRSGIRRR